MDQYLDQINQSLEKILPRKFTKESLEAVIGKTNYDLDQGAINKAINEPIWDLLDRGGKRWRPKLFLTIIDLFGKDPDEYVDLASVFELIHNGSLVIDDIEDLSKSRRGKETVHLIYGQDIAINAGNMIYFLPMKVLDQYQFDSEIKVKIYQTYIDEIVKLHLGQGTDIAWHRGLVDSFKITESQYLQMCAFKTGGLSRMLSRIAAIVGGADDKLVKAIGGLGESLGVVFQILDDILNITENDLSTGKGIGDDITEGKISLPVILSFGNLSKEKSARLNEILLFHTTDKKLIAEAINLIQAGQGIEKSRIIMKKLFEGAWGKLEPQLTDGEKKAKLLKLSKFLIDRQI